MIIISQERDTIANYDNIVYIRTKTGLKSLPNGEQTKCCYIDAFYSDDNYIILGSYSTEKRAKEVLKDLTFTSAKIYEMPKE